MTKAKGSRKAPAAAPGVPEESQLRAELGSFAASVSRTANATRDSKASALESILWALESALQDDDEWLKEVASKARDYLKKRNRGPRARVAEARGLRRRIEIEVDRKISEREIAENVVRSLRAYPLLIAGTTIPAFGIAWPAAERESAIEAIEKALKSAFDRGHRADAERLARAVMRASGYDTHRAKNLFSNEDKAAARGRGR